MTLTNGSHFGPFVIRELVSAGGMGSVYRAHEPDFDRDIALKVMNDDISSYADFRSRFDREARTAASVEHPNMATVFNRGDDDGRLWLSMQFIPGADVAAKLGTHGAMTPETTVSCLRQTASALDALHRAQIIHRDIKPENIVLRNGESAQTYLVDFGIAHVVDTTRFTPDGSISGTLGYIAPERLEGEPGGPPSDIYALGCVAYYMLTGRRAFTGIPRVVYLQQSKGRPEPLPESLRSAEAVILRALDPQPTERHESATIFVSALRDALSASG